MADLKKLSSEDKIAVYPFEGVEYDDPPDKVLIDEDKIKYIFNEFYTTKQDGTGIGLAIVKYILEIYNGSIDVKSKVNEGTTFTVKIPIYKDNLND